MYPTVIRMIKESPRGGLELSGYHIPEGASISVSHYIPLDCVATPTYVVVLYRCDVSKPCILQ